MPVPRFMFAFEKFNQKIRRLRHFAAFLIAVMMSVCLIGNASAVVISVSTVHIAGTQWESEYTIYGEDGDPPIREFTIFFDVGNYSNLQLLGAPVNWDGIVVDPDIALPAEGFFDALALVEAVNPGAILGGFKLGFDYSGPGAPGRQYFEIIDPETFSTLASGFTERETSGSVPEPGTLLLMGCMLPVMLGLRRKLAANAVAVAGSFSGRGK